MRGLSGASPGGSPIGGKTERRTPSIGCLCHRSCPYTLTQPKHSRDSEQGPPAGCPPQGWPGSPRGRAGGVPLPARRALCLPHPLLHLPWLRSPPAPHIPRIPPGVSTAPARTRAPNPRSSALRGSETRPCATLHTKAALPHAHSPCYTHLRGPAFSDVPRLRGS